MGTFLAIVFVSIGAVFIKSIIRDVQRDQSRQARADERRRRAKARAAAVPQPTAVAPPMETGRSESLVNDIGEAVVEGIADADHGSDGTSSNVGRAIASSAKSGGHGLDETDDQPAAKHVEAGQVEADDADSDDDDNGSSDSGESWSLDDD